MDKILTIIVPAYNMEKYLERCLSSMILADKEMDMLEVLVINDGSKDLTSAIGHTFEGKYPQTFRIIDKENGHYGSCVNIGLREARGKYVKVLDADDYFSKSFAEYLGFASKSDADLLLSEYNSIRPDHQYAFYRFSIPSNTALGLDRLSNEQVYDLPHQSIAYKRDLLLDIHYTQTEGLPYTDLEWVSYPMIAVKSVAYFPKVVYEYDLTREGQSVSQAFHINAMYEDCTIVEKMVSYYELNKNDIPDDNRRILGEIVFSNLVRIYFHFLLNWPKRIDNNLLIQFDDTIRSSSPELYQRADSILEKRKFMTFRYIHEWRKNQTRKTPLFYFFDLGIALGGSVRRIKRLF